MNVKPRKLMDVRLVQLLGSFITGTSNYALARLETAMAFSTREAPPVLRRLPDASEDTLRTRWDGVEDDLAAVARWLKQFEATADSTARSDPAYLWLRRTARELEQYARAVRWFITVTEPGRTGDQSP